MSESATSNENIVQPVAVLNNDGESAGHGSPTNISTATQRVEGVPKDENSPPTQTAALSPTEQKSQPDETKLNELIQLQLLRLLTHESPENEYKSSHGEEIKALQMKFFGLKKAKTDVNNRFDYEQKYPADPPGEELASDARVWSTYLDEASAYDREKVDGMKETADVLLVFAGLFSGVITTFVSQASQSLAQDNTLVSASLLFETTKLLRAQISGTPISNIPSSTLDPTSPFTPTTNAFLVNGLWFTSLAITLSTALFAVLSKQWLYYYLSSIHGTPRERARARQFRFQGFKLWKVAAIIDLLPVLLHLAVGLFLTGIIILLFPLDIRVAWTIVAITGVTYTLYFVSAILPIWLPGCPYTTSLTIYIGAPFFFLLWVGQALDSVIPLDSLYDSPYLKPIFLILLQQIYIIRDFPIWSRVRRNFKRSISTVTKFQDWREEKIKDAVASAASLDLNALHWLYDTSSATSVHRIIARCAFIHRDVTKGIKLDIIDKFWRILEASETNKTNSKTNACFRQELCFDLLSREYNCWSLILPDPSTGGVRDVELRGQMDEAELKKYSDIAENVVNERYTQVLRDIIKDVDFQVPLIMWRCFFARASGDAEVAKHIITCKGENIFSWRNDTPAHAVSSSELQKWRFDYLFRYFRHDNPDHSRPFETRYHLLVSVYYNLTSKKPVIGDEDQRRETLDLLFHHFYDWLDPKSNATISPRGLDYFTFFIEIFCKDTWDGSIMSEPIRDRAIECFDRIWVTMGAYERETFFNREYDNLIPAYKWCSRDLNAKLSQLTSPIFALLLVPKNCTRLHTILSADPHAQAVTNLSAYLKNLGNCKSDSSINIHWRLWDLFTSMNRNAPLFPTFYNLSVLVRLWIYFMAYPSKIRMFLVAVKSKLDPQDLHRLHGIMNEEAQYEQHLDRRQKLEESVRWFGKIIAYSQPQSNDGNQITQRNHDAEERAQIEVTAPASKLRQRLAEIDVLLEEAVANCKLGYLSLAKS